MRVDIPPRMCKERIVISCHSSIADFDPKEWENASPHQIYLSLPYLRALELSGAPITLVLFKRDGQPIGRALFQTASFNGAPLKSYLNLECALLNLVVRPIKALKKPFQTRMVICGSPYTAGPHGYGFQNDVTPEVAGFALSRAARVAKASFDKEGRTDGVLIKEFCDDDAQYEVELRHHRYAVFETDPAMVLPVDNSWKSFDDYLASLSSKYRVKAKRAYAKSEDLTVRDLSVADLHRYRDQAADLYHAVANRAQFKLGGLDTNTLFSLRKEMGSKFLLKGYFFEQKLVGFWMGFVNKDTLDAGLVGIDYRLNRSYSIYPRMLYDYLRSAINRGLRKVNYGRTAGEIKSTLGAVPVPTRCCLKLNKPALNAVLPAFKGSLKPPSFAVRKPFKKEWYASSKDRIPSHLFVAPQHSGLRGGVSRGVFRRIPNRACIDRPYWTGTVCFARCYDFPWTTLRLCRCVRYICE